MKKIASTLSPANLLGERTPGKERLLSGVAGAAVGSFPGLAAGTAVGLLRALLSKRARQKHGVLGTIAHDAGMGALTTGGVVGAASAASPNALRNALNK